MTKINKKQNKLSNKNAKNPKGGVRDAKSNSGQNHKTSKYGKKRKVQQKRRKEDDLSDFEEVDAENTDLNVCFVF